jgi:hypothetical protein
MPLLKNPHGRIVAVNQSRVKPLLREGFTQATDEEVADWQAKNSRYAKSKVTEPAPEPQTSEEGQTNEPEPFALPEGYREALEAAMTKPQLVAFALEHFDLALSESMNKDPMLDAIIAAAIQSETAPLPE